MNENKPSTFSLNPNQLEQLAAETQLLALGNIVPLKISVDLHQLENELKQFDQSWVDYLPRPDRVNNRVGLPLFSLPGDTLKDGISLPQGMARANKRVSELDFNEPTEVYKACKSLHPLFETFSPVGRSFLVKCNAGGWFYPHRDHPRLFRDSMRIIVFCKNSKAEQYDWIIDGRKFEIEEGRAYYVNTRLMHKTISYVNDSIHLILNIPVTWQNAQRVVENLQHGH